MIIIGEISKAQGVKGEIKVNPLTEDVNRFNDLKSVTLAGKIYAVQYAKVLCNGVFLKLEGVDDRNTAETLVGKKVSIPREDAKKLKQDEYFIVDVIGSKVTLDGEELGILEDIQQYGSADVYVVKCKDKKTVLFPFLKKVIGNVDIENKIIDLKKKVFEEIAVYED